RDGVIWAANSSTGATHYYQHSWKATGLVDPSTWNNSGQGLDLNVYYGNTSVPLGSEIGIYGPPAVPSPNECSPCFEGGDGITYERRADGTLWRFRLRPSLADPAGAWVNGGLQIGNGWQGFTFVFAEPGSYFIEGYVST